MKTYSEFVTEAVDKHVLTSDYGKQVEFKVGDHLGVPFPKGYGGHHAHLEITKINKKSIHGVEQKGSYHAGREWKVHTGATFFADRRQPDGKIHTHWFNDN
jgi:hypothetical protein